MPSWIKSSSSIFRLVYFLATLTTSRKFAATIRSFALRPALIRFFSTASPKPTAFASSAWLGLQPSCCSSSSSCSSIAISSCT